jgi:hypothetical protein
MHISSSLYDIINVRVAYLALRDLHWNPSRHATYLRFADNCPLKVAELLQGGHVADKSSVVPKNILKTRHKGPHDQRRRP